jgi:predicted outer membrane protein
MFRDSKMKALFLLTFAASMLVVHICTIPADAQTDYPVYVSEDSAPPQTSTFVSLATLTSKFIETADRLALARSRNPRIRRFAQESIRKENRTSNTMTDLADLDHALSTGRSAGGPIVLVAGGDGTVSVSSAMLKELTSLSRREFNVAYLRHQITAHQHLLVAYRAYAQNGNDVDMRSMATGEVPRLQHELYRLKAIVRIGPDGGLPF